MASSPTPRFIVFGAGVIGLTTALRLRTAFPTSSITIVAKHFPGDRSIEYTSPWAGANWCSMAYDNGPLENYDRISFRKFGELVDRTPEAGIVRMPLRGLFDGKIDEVDMLSEGTGKIWYEEMVGGIKSVEGEELQGAVFGVEYMTFMINSQVYLGW